MNIKKVFRTIGNIKKFWPVLKEDRDFDYEYLLDIMQLKMRSMQEFFESGKAATQSAPESAAEIGDALTLLNRYLENEYAESEIAQLKDENGVISGVNKAAKYFGLRRTADEMRQDDLKRFFELLGENIENWWD